MTPTTTENQTIEIREATSGAERAQAAGVWLRVGGSRGSDAPSAPVLVAYVDGTPRAVAQVHTNRFGVLGLRRFFVIPDVDRTAIHDAFVDYAQRGEEAPREHSLQASATKMPFSGAALSRRPALTTDAPSRSRPVSRSRVVG